MKEQFVTYIDDLTEDAQKRLLERIHPAGREINWALFPVAVMEWDSKKGENCGD